MADDEVITKHTNMNCVQQDNGLPLVDPNILTDKRVMLVRDLDVETVLAGMKPFLQYTHIDAINAEPNRGTKAGLLIDIIQRMSYNQYTMLNAFMKLVAGTQPDLFGRLADRAPSEAEADFCVERFEKCLRECIRGHGHSPDSPLDQKIDLDCDHVQLTIVRDTVDSEASRELHSKQLGTAAAVPSAVAAGTETSDALHPSYLSKCSDNVPAVEVLTSVTGEEKPKHVLMTGRAGTGKSTTMQWLAREWSFNRWETDFTLVFFLQLRMLSLFDCPMTVIELLMLHSLYTVREADLVCLVSSWLKTSGARVLIFIDGLDEVSGFTERCQKIFKFTDKGHPIDLCLNILHGNLLPMVTVVSTSRPFSGLMGRIHFQRHFEIIGLSESKVIEFVRQKHPSKAVSIVSVLRDSPLIMSICGITFYCALISSLIADGVIFKSDDLQTYTRLISFIMVQHVSRKLTQWSFLIEVSPYLHKLGSMAYEGIFGRQLDRKMTKLVFNQFDIVQSQLNSQELSSLQRTGLLQTKTLMAGLGRDTFAEFFHFSIQELLASAYLLSHYPNTQTDFKQLFSAGQFNMAQMYLFGLSNDTGSRWLREVRFAVNPSGQGVSNVIAKYIDDLVEELCEQCHADIQSTNKLLLCQLLHEGQMVDKAKAVSNSIAPMGILTIENIPLTIIDLIALRFVCKHGQAISEITLSNCNANRTLIDFMGSSIMKDNETTLDTLRITRNVLDAESIASIARLLQKVQILDIRSNNIDQNGATVIAAALKNNSNLKILKVGINNIGEKGATAIAAALRENTALQTLDVSGNNIGEKGATAIAEALQNNQIIQTLDVGSNNIGDNGATAIAAALENNDTLCKLNVVYNNIGDDGAAAIAAALQNNTTLRLLEYSLNNIGDAGIKALRDAMHQGLTITPNPTKNLHKGFEFTKYI